MADISSILERTRNLVANHCIPIEKNTDLSGLCMSTRKLARATELTQTDEHTAQLFFAQRGYDLSNHLKNILSTTRIEPRPQRVIPNLDFDLEEFIENQQNVVISNVIQSSLSHHHLANTDLFSQSLSNDWQNSKNAILQSMSYNIALPDTAQINNESNISNDPLQIPQSYSEQFTKTQQFYSNVMSQFVQNMHQSHLQKDSIGFSEIILSLPNQLIQVSRDLEQLELNTPLSTTNAIVSQQSTQNKSPILQSHPLHALKCHEQTSELWIWFDSLSQVLALAHAREQTMGVDAYTAAKSQSTKQLQANNEPQLTQPKLQYRYKNWFLPTAAGHGVIATVDYLQQSFIQHMTDIIGADDELSQEYQRQVEYIADDNNLMIELAVLFTRSREFKSRFIAQQYDGNNQNDLVQLDFQNNQTNNSIFGSNNQINPNIGNSAHNLWSIIYCCIRAGYYGAAVKLLTEAQLEYSNTLNCQTLISVLNLYVDHLEQDPTTELAIPNQLWTELYYEMCTPMSASQNSAQNAQNNQVYRDSANASNPFRKVVYSILGHFPLLVQEMKQRITPLVLTTIEDFLWYRLRLITQQMLPTTLLDSYRILASIGSGIGGHNQSFNQSFQNSQNNNANLLDQLNLSSLQTSILTRGKSYFTGVGSNGPTIGNNQQQQQQQQQYHSQQRTLNQINGSLLYVHVLFLTQQFERAIVEFYSLNPILALHLALICLFFGLIRTTDLQSDLLIPINLSLKSLQILQSSSNNNTTNTPNATSQLGYLALQQTQHARYAINVYKLLVNYIQIIQAHSVSNAVCYAYCTRFIPLFGNIGLYNSYLTNNPTFKDELLRKSDNNGVTSQGQVIFGQNNTLTSLEYNINMAINSSIPKSLLKLYQSTLLNLNTPLSSLVLTHDQVNMTPLQYQQHYFQKRSQQQQQQQQNSSNNTNILNSDMTFMGDNRINDGNDLNSSIFNVNNFQQNSQNSQNNNINLLNDFLMNTSLLNTTVAKTLITTIANSFGVELPLIIDLLLLNKIESEALLGPGQSIYNYPSNSRQNQQQGILSEFYSPDVILAVVQLVVSRDKQQ